MTEYFFDRVFFESVFFNDAQRDVSRRLGGGGVGRGSGRWGREEEGS